MVDITSEAARSVSESSRYKTEGLSLENQINVAEYIRTYLNDPKNVGELIPAMAAAGTNTAIAKQIEDYNSRETAGEQLGAQPRHSGPRQPAGRRAAFDHLVARLQHLDARNPARRHAQGGDAGQHPHLDHAFAGEGHPGHHAPAEDQGRTVPLPAEQAGGEPAQLCRGREQLAVDRLRLRQQRSRIAR